MLFTEISFWLFLPLVFSLYWITGSRRRNEQNLLLLAASYFFYACWDWRFLFLLIFSTLLDYCGGILISRTSQPLKRKIWLWICIAINHGFLAFFKYYNFFIQSFTELLRLGGIESHPLLLSLILPVGISFYTFHGLSYVIDVYYNRIDAEHNFPDYALFVSWFPLLVAGPIERASHLLPQLKQNRVFSYREAGERAQANTLGAF